MKQWINFMDKEYLPDFTDKCLSISITSDTASHDLFNPRFEYQGGKLFLIGTVLVGATCSDWVANKVGAVAWELVTEYFVFDNIEEYTVATNMSESNQEKSNEQAVE
jgi:hypothetical protein